MTQWGVDTLFNPAKRHMDEEKRRLQSTREEVGDNSGGQRIDLTSGKVRILRADAAGTQDDADAVGTQDDADVVGTQDDPERDETSGDGLDQPAAAAHDSAGTADAAAAASAEPGPASTPTERARRRRAAARSAKSGHSGR